MCSRALVALKRRGQVEGLHPDQAARRCRLHQCALIRCLFANPFRRWRLEQEWADWADGTPRRIARAIYEDGRFDEMPVLGDALADAGCDDAAVLRHCHEGRVHARGCWVVDALLGKN